MMCVILHQDYFFVYVFTEVPLLQMHLHCPKASFLRLLLVSKKLETRHSDHFLQKEVWCLTHSRQILKTAALFCWWNWRKFSQEVLICTGIYCICFFSCCHPAPTPMHTRWTGLLRQELFVTAYVTSANESPLQNGGYNHCEVTNTRALKILSLFPSAFWRGTSRLVFKFSLNKTRF